jgi:hypothetical protein
MNQAEQGAPSVKLLGCDFSSSPSARKPIVVATGVLEKTRVRVLQLQSYATLGEFTQSLQAPGGWVGGFDLPFGLPRTLVQTLGWPLTWQDCLAHYCGLSRAAIREQFMAFCQARPVGAKFAHRQTDGPTGSSPSMKWVNPPVAYMLHAGVPCLLAAGAFFPGLQAPVPNPEKIALEAYPGLLAREILGRRSYKSDTRAKQTAERLIARKDLVHALEMGQTRLGLQLKLSPAQCDALVADASGDTLDAVLCLIQAAWAQRQHSRGHASYGLPADMDNLEGAILTT